MSKQPHMNGARVGASLTTPAPAAASGAEARMRKRMDQLTQQRDAIQRQIDSYEFVIADLHAERTHDKGPAMAAMIRTAITLDGERRGSVAERVAEAIRTHADDVAIEVKPIAVRLGCATARVADYLRKNGYRAIGNASAARWIKTSGPAPRTASADKIAHRRASSARTLSAFAPTEARPSSVAGAGAKAIGALIRRGYLARKGAGYIRTANTSASTRRARNKPDSRAIRCSLAFWFPAGPMQDGCFPRGAKLLCLRRHS